MTGNGRSPGSAMSYSIRRWPAGVVWSVGKRTPHPIVSCTYRYWEVGNGKARAHQTGLGNSAKTCLARGYFTLGVGNLISDFRLNCAPTQQKRQCPNLV